MLHAALLPEHARWANFLARTRFLVLDEVHVFDGIFGANVAGLIRRLDRVFAHYGAAPRLIACSATVGIPEELGRRLTGRDLALVDEDGSPRGKRTVVFWNPPRVRATRRRARRSANVETHELMAALVASGVPTICFSKARVSEPLHVGNPVRRRTGYDGCNPFLVSRTWT